jgi:hypothetical protein
MYKWIIRAIKPRRLNWARHMALCGKGEKNTWVLWPNPREGNHLEDLGVGYGRIILKWIFKKGNERVDWTELAQDRDRLWALCE